ncbi:MAG: uroporphyrinogen-III synthase [Candidatus Odyssella sp.]|nr:uroporphyrinogen-III synthase [Candidatus Odyssella sp.]
MRILVTRPASEAQRFAAQLAGHGIESVIAPLLAIEPVETPLPPFDAVQALVFTSANGVRAYAARETRRDVPAYAVGEATAAAAREAGFANAISAGSDAEGLAALLVDRIDPAQGPLLHVAGADQAGDLPGALRARGYEVRQAVLYHAAPAPELPAPARAAIEAGSIAGVALFSPRSAGLFADRAAAAGLAAKLATLDAYCLSRAVAAALEGKATFRAVRVAARPNAEALIAAIRAAETEERRPMNDEPVSTPNEAERIIAAFGGIRPMAKALGIAVGTVQGWKERGAIPLKRMGEIRESAARVGIDLAAALAEPPTEPPAAEPAPAAPAEALAAEKVSAGPEPGLRAAEAAPPPPPRLDAPPPPRPVEPGRMRWAMFGAGFGAAFVAGAVVAASLGIGGRSGGEQDRQGALDRLQSRINSVTAQLEEQQKRQQAEAAQVQARLNRIEQAERAIGEQRERLAGLAASAAALAARIEKIDTDLKSLAQRAAASPEDLKGVREQIDALARRLEALPKEAPGGEALAALSAQLRQAGERMAALERRLGELAQARPGAESELKSALDKQAAEGKAALDRLAAEARAQGQKLAGEAEQLKKDLAALQSRVGAIADEVRRAGSAANETGTLLVALGQLRRAVQDGGAYRPALDAAKALAKERKEFEAGLAMLGARADQGVPTAAQLRQRFDKLAVSVLRAAAAAKPDADMWDRIWARVSSLVTVRRVGEVEGEGAAAALSRAEAALARGDLGEAAKQLNALAGPARAAAEGWLADARARLVTDAALAEIERAALGLLGRPDPKSRP